MSSQTPPNSKANEAGILGCILKDSRVLPQVLEQIRTEHFYHSAHRAIFGAIMRLHQTGKPIDIATVGEELVGQFEEIGGAIRLCELRDAEPIPDNAAGYAQEVRRLAVLREKARIHGEIHQAAIAGNVVGVEEGELQLRKLAEEMPTGPRIEMYSAAEIMESEPEESRFAIPGLLPEGLAVLAGKSKLGKSWLCYHEALAMASGGVVLGKIQVDQRDCLYLALEDTKTRMRNRLVKLLGSWGEAPKNLTIARAWPRQHQGGLDKIDAWLSRHKGGAVTIDTWPKFRPPKKRGQDPYQEDYDHGSQLKAVVDAHPGAVIQTVHHCRKMPAEDWLDAVSGTVGLVGAADAIHVLCRERGQHDATLFVTGRDVDEAELALKWDKQYCLWSMLGEADEFRISKERTKILDVMRQEKRSMKPNEVSPLIPGAHRDTVRWHMWSMAKDGWLKPEGDGSYVLNGQAH